MINLEKNTNMKYGGLIIEEKEYEKLIELIGMSHHRKDLTYQASVEKLLLELESAEKRTFDEMPDDVVRFNSAVSISMPDGNVRNIQVVFPDKSDVSANKISILAPMSLALFGYAANDVIMWQFPSGMQAIKILNVEQLVPVKK